MARKVVYRRTDPYGTEKPPFEVIAEGTVTAQDMDDEEDAVWEAAIASGRLRVIPVRG
jgi:hypothetical protein